MYIDCLPCLFAFQARVEDRHLIARFSSIASSTLSFSFYFIIGFADFLRKWDMAEEFSYLTMPEEPEIEGITFHKYESQSEINDYKRINDTMLSEAYSVYTYHYFVDHNPDITFSVRLCSL